MDGKNIVIHPYMQQKLIHIYILHFLPCLRSEKQIHLILECCCSSTSTRKQQVLKPDHKSQRKDPFCPLMMNNLCNFYIFLNYGMPSNIKSSATLLSQALYDQPETHIQIHESV